MVSETGGTGNWCSDRKYCDRTTAVSADSGPLHRAGWLEDCHLDGGRGAVVGADHSIARDEERSFRSRRQTVGEDNIPVSPEVAIGSDPVHEALNALRRGARSIDFWLLAGSFFVCGASTNGLIGTHLVPACMDHGMPEVHAAGLLAMMGVFDLVGTTASGWLSDRCSNRWLLFTYYGLRGLALLFL